MSIVELSIVNRRTFLALFLLFVVLCSNPAAFAEPENTFHGCPAEGDATAATQADPELNRLKNRIEFPNGYEAVPIETLIALKVPAGVSKRHRDRWPAETLADVRSQEKRAVQVEGYLVAVKQEGPESCNCRLKQDRDFHMWLAGLRNGDRRQAMVIEVSPRVRAQHPRWQLKLLRKHVDHGLVRVSGWLMLDPEHPEQVGKTRATLWEIHPILKIEVRDARGWHEL